MRIAVCPGSFDPITLGHLDIILRASKLFDKLIVLVTDNRNKKLAFTTDERVELVNIALSDYPEITNIEVDTCNGLLANYVKDNKATAIVKGLRAMSDFEYEFQMALANKKLFGEAETVFLTAQSEYMYLSSSVVKQILPLGGDITGFVPDKTIEIIKKRLK